MREDAFRAYLAPLLGRRSVDRYVSDAWRGERLLNADLDAVTLDDDVLASCANRLAREGIPIKGVGNCLSSLRRYTELAHRRPA